VTIGPRGRGGVQNLSEALAPRGGLFDLLEKRIFLFFCFLFFYFFYLGLFFEIIHEPLRLEEGTLVEDDSLQAQAYLVLDRREEVRQAP